MSIHFAPQWVKPIKPSGAGVTPTDGLPSQASKASPSVPFPALSQLNHPRAGSPTTPGGGGATTSAANPPLSYSRITHTPISPGVAQDGYFPYTDAPNGAEPTPYPFRYSREQMLALWDEEKVKERPIELLNMDENGANIVSKGVVKPVGLRDMTELEKKILSSNIHPPAPVRRQPIHNVNPPVGDTTGANAGVPTRRPIGPPSAAKDSTAPGGLANGRSSAGFGGFGRGEGGAFGGGKFGGVSGLNTGQPGVVGGGFGGVGKRTRVRTESAEVTGTGDTAARPSAASTWRPSRTLSGTFEGVLGFSNTASSNNTALTPAAAAPVSVPESVAEAVPAASVTGSSGRRERTTTNGHPVAKAEEPTGGRAAVADFGNGGGPGWGSGQRKWRSVAGIAQTEEKTLTVPITDHENASESVIASASVTPQSERDAAVLAATKTPIETPFETVPADPSQRSAPIPGESMPAPAVVQEKEDLSNIQWFYRDPNGQEQGPFTGVQMHDWYSHSYFNDDLPLRRESESNFHSLAELKAATGNSVQPFLSPVRPRVPPPPPNLPIPFGAQSNIPILQRAPLVEQFRGLTMQSPAAPSPQFNNQLNNAPYSPHHVPLSGGEPGQFRPSPQAWSAGSQSPMNRINGVYGSIGPAAPGQSPISPFILHQQQPHSMYPLGPGQLPQGPGHMLAAGAEMFNAANDPMYPQVSPWGPNVVIPGAPSSASAVFPQSQQQQQPWHQQCPPQEPQRSSEQQSDIQSLQPDIQSQQPTARPEEPSYFPPVEQVASVAEPEAPQAPIEEPLSTEEKSLPVEDVVQPVDEVAAVQEEQIVEEELHVKEVSVPETPISKAPPPSVWGQKSLATSTKPASSTPSRKASLSQQPQPSPPITSTLPPPPASLPAKPVTRAEPNSVTTSPVHSPAATLATPDRPSSKPAPWAVADKAVVTSTGPSLREIQETEARHAEARKQALADARAASASPAPLPTSSSNEEFPSTIAWGLPSTGAGGKGSTTSASVSSPSISTPPPPAWGTSESAAPKKTLKQIQQEEERRRAAVANQRAQVQAAAGSASPNGAVLAVHKRGYADLAATTSASAPAASASAGWTTVGAGGKTSGPAAATGRPAVPTLATRAATSTIMSPKPATTGTAQTGAQKIAKANGSDEFAAPSVEFIRWTKQALSGLSVNVDEFIQMLLQFPIDPPASSRGDVLEIISDSVYASSATLDGRHFAQEFFDRRKADALRSASGAGKPVARVGNLADVVKTQPKPAAGADLGFKVVKSKKGKKAQ